ncbi:MAG: dihydrolipoyl dehydrogenase [Desulfobacterales bacterium]|nr:dihydrolipoyl dehydrogenase [Desulfobacterales bacterium]
MEDRDVVIIGGGPAGYTAAIRVAQLGAKATIVEKDTIGGICVNHGCIPTVALARAVELLDMAKNAKDYGINYEGVKVDFPRMMSRKDAVVRTLVSGVKQMLEAYGVEVIEGKGRLISSSLIEVHLKDGTKKELRARKIIISTGSQYPKAFFSGGVEKVINPIEALRLNEIPKSILIVGGGFIGAAFVTIFSKLGAKVSIVEESSRMLPQVDKEIVFILEKEFKDNDVQIYSKARVMNVESGKEDGLMVLINVKGEEVTAGAQYVLMTELREANIDGLGLREVGVELNKKRGILVNERMETSVPGIFAVGDVTMEHMWTTVAYFEGMTAAEIAMGQNSKVDYRAIPLWTHTIPEISCVGMTEEESAAKGYKVRVGRFPFAGNGMAAILGQRRGMVKVIMEERYGEILGVHMIGPRTGDLIGEAALAMKVEGTPGEIAKTFHVHPSLSEALWEAARGT